LDDAISQQVGQQAALDATTVVTGAAPETEALTTLSTAGLDADTAALAAGSAQLSADAASLVAPVTQGTAAAGGAVPTSLGDKAVAQIATKVATATLAKNGVNVASPALQSALAQQVALAQANLVASPPGGSPGMSGQRVANADLPVELFTNQVSTLQRIEPAAALVIVGLIALKALAA
jgi:hypothetical protein